MPTPHPDILSAYSGVVFEKCCQCGFKLGQPDYWYSIQKLIVADEVVFELALCGKCAIQLARSFSTESSARIQSMAEQSAQVQRRMEQFLEYLNADFDDVDLAEGDEDPLYVEIRDERLNECGFCSRQRSDCHRYSLYFNCSAQEISVDAPLGLGPGGPLLTCSECEERISRLLSTDTRDTWARFIESNFDGPPSLDEDVPTMSIAPNHPFVPA